MADDDPTSGTTGLRAATRGVLVGVVVTLVLLGVGGTLSAWRALASLEALETFVEQPQSNLVSVADAGRLVARLRANLSEEVASLPGLPGRADARARRDVLLRDLQRDVLRLSSSPQGADPSTRLLLGEIRAFRDSLHATEAAFDAGGRARAEPYLAETNRRAARAQQRVDEVLAEERRRVTGGITELRGQLRRFLVVEAAVALLTMATLLLVWSRVIAAQRTATDVIDRNVRRLEELNRDLDAFAGRLAHDFRGILAPLPVLAAQLEHSSAEGVRVRAADRLRQVVGRGERLIEGLLAFTRAAAKGPATTRLHAALAELVDDLGPAAREAGVTLDTRTDEWLEVAAPAALVHMMLANLAGNAVKFLGEARERRVTLDAIPREGGVEISVHDTGPGIAPELVGRVFEPFFRGPGTTAAGTGLGLATVRRLAESLGGSVTLESAPGHGTTARLWLPSPAEPGATIH